MENKHGQALLFFVLLCLAIQIIGGYWTNQTVFTWYPQLSKPAWTPPGWVFGPVWFILYMMIAVSGWLLYKAENSFYRTAALISYAGQLAINCMWSFLFFSLQSPFLGFIDIVLLNLLIIVTIFYAWQVRRLASFLLIPYLIWVMYATSLNGGIWVLNDNCKNNIFCNGLHGYYVGIS